MSTHLSYFEIPVADAERAQTFYGALGGQADSPVTLPSGRFARCQDDQGTRFTLWQDAPAS